MFYVLSCVSDSSLYVCVTDGEREAKRRCIEEAKEAAKNTEPTLEVQVEAEAYEAKQAELPQVDVE